MRFGRGLLIFCYGLFSIAAQTLLFREFVTTFEGNDISVALFFSSWFLWVGAGAVLVNRMPALAEKLVNHIELFFLIYLPAFVLELIMIVQAREIAGIESYTLLSIRAVLVLSVLVNAPVSIVTGMFFPTACRWVGRDEKPAISRVYILEAAGSFAGGLGVTVLLAADVVSTTIFMILAFVVSFSALVVCFVRVRRQITATGVVKALTVGLIAVLVVVGLVVGLDSRLTDHLRAVKWAKLLPAEALEGSFQTDQAEYLYGQYQGQWIVMREGSVCEALPDESGAGKTAAISLCQNPGVRNVLVVGSGLGVCRQLLKLPQIEHVAWAHSDIEYVEKVNEFVPGQLQVGDERLHRVGGEIRSMLTERRRFYDIVILNLPDATSSILNRYYTLEFYRLVKASLGAEGVLAVRIAGGENIMGTELVSLGASTKLTLEKVFSRTVLTPGEDTWFIASDSEKLTGSPGALRDRFAGLDGAAEILPPDALFSIYLPRRSAAAVESYSKADLPERLLINQDSRPLTHLYSLLLAAKQSGAPVTRFVKHLALAGPWAFFIPIIVLVVLRVVYVLRTTGQVGAASFDSTFLVFSAGLAGIAVVIVLMYLYQTHFGSLYLHIGVISSVFMVGLTVGALLVFFILRRQSQRTHSVVLFAVIAVHTLVLFAIAFWPEGRWTHSAFAAAFVFCGLCGGCYFPLAARGLTDSGFTTGSAAGKLERADHVGAAAGGLVTGLALVPVLGTRLAFLVLIALILANVPVALARLYRRKEVSLSAAGAFGFRGLGYTLFGAGLTVVLCSNLLASAGAQLRAALPEGAAQALAGEAEIRRVSASLAGENRRFDYFEVYRQKEQEAQEPSVSSAELGGYILSSEDFAPGIRGFGGRINIALYVDLDGRLINFHTIRSNETPSYYDMLREWFGLLKKRMLFGPEPFGGIDVVSGATVSSEAVLSALQTSGHSFARQILGRAVEGGANEKARGANYIPDGRSIYFMSAFVLALIVTYQGGFWSRLAVLVFSLIAGGIILNVQYSSEQIASLLSWEFPAASLRGPFLLVVGTPVLVLIFGNYYCGYVCPFGAAQELLSYVVPGRFKQVLSKQKMRKARFIKYVFLFVLIIVMFLSRDRATLGADPLISFFNFQSAIILMAGAVLVISIFYTRFWCRYLCPAGAMLSLFSGVAIFKRFLPVKKFGRCEFGLAPRDQLDCIYCDRCRYNRYEGRPSVQREDRRSGRVLVVCVLMFAAVLSWLSVDSFVKVMPGELSEPASFAFVGGQARDLNLNQVRTMIDQGGLSGREALFYRKIEPDERGRALRQAAPGVSGGSD